MCGQAAGVRDQARDLGEQHDPRRIGHVADQDVAGADVVELVLAQHDPGRALDDARRAGNALELVRDLTFLAREFLREAPVDEIREVELALRRSADPRPRSELVRLLALCLALRDQRPGVEQPTGRR